MQRTLVTAQIEVMHRDAITPGEIREDLVKQLSQGGANRPPEEPRPWRGQECGWWALGALVKRSRTFPA